LGGCVESLPVGESGSGCPPAARRRAQRAPPSSSLTAQRRPISLPLDKPFAVWRAAVPRASSASSARPCVASRAPLLAPHALHAHVLLSARPTPRLPQAFGTRRRGRRELLCPARRPASCVFPRSLSPSSLSPAPCTRAHGKSPRCRAGARLCQPAARARTKTVIRYTLRTPLRKRGEQCLTSQ
jgi:hypothetical protein